MKPHYLAIMFLGLVPVGLAFTPSESVTAASGDVGCKIKALSSPGGVHLQGVATAKRPISGTYELAVTARGNGGSSNSFQSGDFTAGPDGESALGAVSLGLGSRAPYTAVLTIEWAGGSMTCSRGS